MKKTLAVLSTQIVEFRSPLEPTEGGVFEIDVEIDMTQLRKSGSPRQFFFREIGRILGHGIQSTTIPKEYWVVTFSDFARTEFNLPATVSFGAT